MINFDSFICMFDINGHNTARLHNEVDKAPLAAFILDEIAITTKGPNKIT